MSQADILKIATAKATAIGYDEKKLKAYMDADNSIWKDQLKRIPPEYNNIVMKLKHREYWAVYFRPEPLQFGGELFVFVDKRTGEVIETMAFQ